ncbi:MAG: YraN family protein [Candidatus Poribacteria bacterium]|nr:YraN family protein [Candidatus Poribacteria bacterium]
MVDQRRQPNQHNQRIGIKGEEVAAIYLEGQGLRVIDRNVRTPYGELDLIAQDGDTLVFIEVKTRSSTRHGAPQEAINRRKRLRLCRAATVYLSSDEAGGKWDDAPVRFDVIAVHRDRGSSRVEHFRDAFTADDLDLLGDSFA